MLRFNTAKTQYIEPNFLVLDEEECKARWYTKDELAKFQKKFAKAAARLFKEGQVTQESQGALVKLYEKSQENGYQLSNSSKIDLVRLYIKCEDAVGLEFAIMDKIQDRRDTRQALLKAVRFIQGKSDADFMGFCREEVMRKKCLMTTHQSRTFATHVGMAKAASAVLGTSGAKSLKVSAPAESIKTQSVEIPAIKLSSSSKKRSSKKAKKPTTKKTKKSRSQRRLVTLHEDSETSSSESDDESVDFARPRLVKQAAFKAKPLTDEEATNSLRKPGMLFKQTRASKRNLLLNEHNVDEQLTLRQARPGLRRASVVVNPAAE